MTYRQVQPITAALILALVSAPGFAADRTNDGTRSPSADQAVEARPSGGSDAQSPALARDENASESSTDRAARGASENRKRSERLLHSNSGLVRGM